MSGPQVDLRYIAESQPSLCIPRVYHNITYERIYRAFDEICLGDIARIDIKERQSNTGEKFNRVYIHFKKWYWNDNAVRSRTKLLEGGEIKIVYDNPWFWKVSASKWMPVNRDVGPNPIQYGRTRVEFDDVDRRPVRPDSRHRPRQEMHRPEMHRPEMHRPEMHRPELHRPRPDSRQRQRPNGRTNDGRTNDHTSKPQRRYVDSRERPTKRPIEPTQVVPVVHPFVPPPPKRLSRKTEETAKPEEIKKNVVVEVEEDSSDSEDETPYVMDELYADIYPN